MKQIETERGLISVHEEFKTVEEAKAAGYGYMFTSHKLGKHVYGIPKDELGHSWKMVLVEA